MRRARPSTGRWRRCGNTGRSMLYMSRAAGNSRRPGLYFSGSCAMLGPRNKREARLRRRSRPRIAAVPQTHAYSLRSAEAPQWLLQHLRCAGDTAALFAIQQVLFRTGKGGAAMGNRLSKRALPGPGPGASPPHPVCRQQPDSSPLPPGGGSQAGRRSAGAQVPDPVLKDIQRRIARVLLSGMPVSPHATAYRYGAGVVENARRQWAALSC